MAVSSSILSAPFGHRSFLRPFAPRRRNATSAGAPGVSGSPRAPWPPATSSRSSVTPLALPWSPTPSRRPGKAE
eukprot:9697739-Alexandrium_andersonii.AAC.1